MAMRNIVHPHSFVLLNKFKIRCRSFFLDRFLPLLPPRNFVFSGIMSLYPSSFIFYCVVLFLVHILFALASQICKLKGKSCVYPVHSAVDAFVLHKT